METKKNKAMMNHFKYLIVCLILFFLSIGCTDQILNKEPLDIISDAAVWNDATLVDSYLANLYFETDFMERRGDKLGVSLSMVPSMAGLARSFGGHHHPFIASTRVLDTDYPGQLDYWPYKNIRDTNFFIEQLQISTLNEDFASQRISEARFLRAYMYFKLVKMFGGVPLVTEAKSPDAPVAEIMVQRSTEKEVYDFVLSELDDLIENLPSQYGASDKGRPTKWAAYALKSRAAIYAASIARYGQQQMNGLLGFPASDDRAYAQMAYDASDAIINSGVHSLYEELGDRADNFHNMLLDDSDANRESIYVDVYDFSKNRAHSFSPRSMPHDFSGSWSAYKFLWEALERFEYKNGAPGDAISRDEIAYSVSGKEWTMDELFGNRDPRFHATVFYPESPWKDGVTYFHFGTYINGELLTAGIAPNGRPNRAHERNVIRTGLMVKKRTRPDVEPSGGFPGLVNDDTDFKVFRLGEMYLNKAEAAYYLGNNAEALSSMNRIRERAGMPPKAVFNMTEYQNERIVELMWENHSYWDLRRWRIAEETLNGARMTGVRWFYNYDTEKYRVAFINAEGNPRIFLSHNYYLPFRLNRVIENPNMVQNPGY